jgi:hypothetical protein
MCRKQQASRDDGPNRTTSSSGRFLGLFTRQRMKEKKKRKKKKEGAGRLAREAWSTCPPGANWAVRSGYICGKKFVAVRLQTRLFAAPHKKEDRPHPQVNNTTKTLSGGPAGGAYPPFCEGLQTA